MSKLKIKTKERRFETARDLYGIFFEDINRAGDGGLYPEMLRNRSFEDSVLPEGYIQQEDGVHVKTVSGWLDEFCNGEGLCLVTILSCCQLHVISCILLTGNHQTVSSQYFSLVFDRYVQSYFFLCFCK